jgi:hypothetical protein
MPLTDPEKLELVLLMLSERSRIWRYGLVERGDTEGEEKKGQKSGSG